MRNSKTSALTECAILIAIAAVLSFIKIVDLPYGGSITIASMLPIVLISYRHGMGWGCASGIVFGIIQQLSGLSALSYVTTWQSIVAVILLDYIIAYAVAGLGGIFRKRVKNQVAALVLGSSFVCIIRYACHVFSGATVWAGISIPTKAALIYSLIYNATYMIPETIIMILISVYLGSIMDFGAALPVRTARNDNATGKSVRSVFAGLSVTAALVFDVAAIFSKLQNADTGEFSITQVSAVNWTSVLAVTAVAVVISAIFAILGRRKKHGA